jgi:uncharacterized protein
MHLCAQSVHEARNGHDVVEWLASQPFCDGHVAMWGGSCLGYCQWATAKEFPPHLATIVPTAAPYRGVDSPMRNNIFFPYSVQWLSFVGGRASQARLFADRAFWSARFRAWHLSGRSLREADELLGNPSPIFQEWLSHPEPDAFWEAMNPTADQYARMQLPILTPEFGGIKAGEASLLDLWKLHIDWYLWTMFDGPKPSFLQKRVAYYVMGADRWRIDAEAATSGDSLVDQSVTLALRGRQLIYHSSPFAEDTEITGFFRLSARDHRRRRQYSPQH